MEQLPPVIAYKHKIESDQILKRAFSFSITMPPVAITAASSSLCFCSQNPSAAQPSNNSQQITNIHLLTPSKPKTSQLQKHPLYLTAQENLSLEFKEKILCLEIMGVDSGRALSLNPSLHTASLYSIHSIISFLQSKGIHQKDMGRIFGMCPKILTSDIKTDLIPVFNFLSNDLRVPEHSFRRAINKCPRLLGSSVRDQLKPALFYLQRLGFRDLEALAYQDSVLLVSSVERTLIPKLEFMVSGMGFSRADAVAMVLRCPTLFTFSVENNFKPKFEYFEKEIMKGGGGLEDLKEFPQYFTFSLEHRIRPRHSEAVQSGAKVPLPLMLKSTDEEFRKLIRRHATG